jgi:hypothetical protein
MLGMMGKKFQNTWKYINVLASSSLYKNAFNVKVTLYLFFHYQAEINKLYISKDGALQWRLNIN